MIIHDVTQAIWSGMAVWPGDPVVRVTDVLSLQTGAPVNLGRLEMGTHSGTHVDAPRHVLVHGASAESLSLEALIGPARLMDVSDEGLVSVSRIASELPCGCQRLILRTVRRACCEAGELSWNALSHEAACWLVDRGLLLLGTDAPSIDLIEAGAGPVHQLLLGAGIVVVEGLALGDIAPGAYDLICLPLKLRGADGAPARALLIE